MKVGVWLRVIVDFVLVILIRVVMVGMLVMLYVLD